MLLPDYLRPGLRVVIAGVAPAGPRDRRRRYYAGRGNAFWYLLHESGLVDDVLGPGDDERVAPTAVAFVSKTAAHAYAQGAGLARPQQYGETRWTVGGRPGFVLPGPSGANNAMPIPLRIALWRDLADFLDTL